MEEKSSVFGFGNLIKNLGQVLTTPVTLTGRPLTPEELRRRRASRARKQLSKSNLLDAGAQASQFCLQGMIEEGKHTPNAIDGEDFEITPGTWVVGLVIPGALAVVKGTVSRNGRRVAKSITIMNPK